MKKAACILCLLALCASASAQQDQTAKPIPLSAKEKNEVIDSLVVKINQLYVYADVAARMTQGIRQHQQKRDYDTITSREVFARRLTDDLHAVNNDGHLGVEASSTPIAEEKPEAPSQAAADAFRKTWSRSNFNIKKAEILEGNIGLLQVDSFFPADWIKDIVQGAMNFLAGTDAIIIDIRQNHGFSDGGFLIASYFFNEPAHWSDVYDRDAKTVRQFWTMHGLPGPKMADKDVYILVSKDCFSAAEDFAYNMQALGRAKIIGEATGGGAHPTKPYKVGTYFYASIPFAYSANPVTKTDWEGKGVQPDVKVPASRALTTARMLAVQAQIARTTDGDRKKSLETLLLKLQQESAGN